MRPATVAYTTTCGNSRPTGSGKRPNVATALAQGPLSRVHPLPARPGRQQPSVTSAATNAARRCTDVELLTVGPRAPSIE